MTLFTNKEHRNAQKRFDRKVANKKKWKEEKEKMKKFQEEFLKAKTPQRAE